jgi:hypothetical protein
MKGIGKLGMLAAFAAMADLALVDDRPIKRGTNKPNLKTKVEQPIPKGCKIYYFTDSGEVSETPTNNKVIALNEKNALKKFNKTPKG